MGKNRLPGPSYYSVLFADNEYVLRGFYEMVYVYHYTEYKTPLCGKIAHDWLSCGTWKKVNDVYKEVDGVGRRTGRVAADIAGIVEKEKMR